MLQKKTTVNSCSFCRIYTISALTLCYNRNSMNSFKCLLCKNLFALKLLQENCRLNCVNHLLLACLYFMVCPINFRVYQNSGYRYVDIGKHFNICTSRITEIWISRGNAFTNNSENKSFMNNKWFTVSFCHYHDKWKSILQHHNGQRLYAESYRLTIWMSVAVSS